ncbi:nuclease SbcCD subunit C [Heyndrickxia sporothermodurans]|nr:nuclease SbcCD subunit C [Heyndrickxia sporothermodurans]
MKPLKLMMQAFGPYAEKEVIDFTALGNRTMFVISGKTGAGKTTIFDAISFAIYGKASGEDRNGSELRSQFAVDDLPTEVSLQFSLRNKTYCIWRSPQQEKRKSRGDGYTTVNARAEIYVVNEEGQKQLLAANVREADEKIKEIIQLDANQFRQILMIPQGEFRKLLISDSKDKEQILQRLFHTELYKRMEEQLKEEATSLKKQVVSKIDERTLALKSIYFTENDELKQELGEDHINNVKIVSLLSEEIKKMKQKTAELHQNIEMKKRDRDEVKKKVDEAETLLNQFNARDQLKKERAELLAKKVYFEQMKVEISQAYKASRLEQQDQLCHRIKKEFDSNQQELQNSKIQLQQILSALDDAEKSLRIEEGRSNERERLADQLIKVTNVKDDVYSLSKREQELQHLEKEFKEIEAKINISKKKIELKEEQLLIKKNEQKQLDNIQLLLLKNENELNHLTNVAQKLNKLNTLIQKESTIDQSLVKKEKLYENAGARLADSRKTLSAVEAKWNIGQASLLARTLVDDSPCPVCGSFHHPNPSLSEEDIPTESDFKSAKLEVEQLEKEYRLIETQLIEEKGNHSHINEIIEDQRSELLTLIPDIKVQDITVTLLHFEEKLSEKQRQIKEQKEASSELTKINNELEQLEEQLKEEKNNLEHYSQKEKEASKLFTEQKITILHSLEKIPQEIRKIDDYEKKIHSLTRQKQQLDQAYESASQEVQKLKEQLSGAQATNEKVSELLLKSEKTLSEEREKFLKMLDEEGFTNYKQFSLAKRDNKVINEKEEQVQNYREELRSVSDRFKELDERLSTVEKPKIEKLNQQFSEVESQLQQMSTIYTNSLMNIRHNEEIMTKVESINTSIEEAEENYRLIGHLSDLARGQNTYRITFERFVLASFLDDILQVANIRLQRMTSGRYRLLRKTDRSKGNVQSGLELLVFDQYTGQERHVKTLSGGESFKASLALALGLADVVQQHAGGVSLETMFIDEGFGTLDPESLDQAIESLMDIQNSGRLVGIISHVPELKERIDAHLEVYTSQNGSKTQFEFIN